MSICLDIVPSSTKIPSAKELKNEIEGILAETSINEYCCLIWSAEDITEFNVLIEYLKPKSGSLDDSEDWDRCSDENLPLSMEGFNYGWLSMDKYKVGFDFYFEENSKSECCENFMYEYMVEMINLSRNEEEIKKYFPLEEAADIYHNWMLRGSVGRSRATWLLAGITATALARLTRGIIFSDDGGADFGGMPATPEAFLEKFPLWCYGAFL